MRFLHLQQLPAPRDPDILAGFCFQCGNDGRRIGRHRHAWMILLAERIGKDNHPLVSQHGAAMLPHPFEGVAAQQKGVELPEQRIEVDLRIEGNPVRFALRTRDLSIQTGRDHIPDFAQCAPPREIS
jgi:hypothetical protein